MGYNSLKTQPIKDDYTRQSNQVDPPNQWHILVTHGGSWLEPSDRRRTQEKFCFLETENQKKEESH